MIPQRSSKKRAAQHIAIYSAGTIIRQLAGFIMLPIYTSYLTPADYGVVGLLVVMVSLFELLIGARFAQAVPKFYYEESSTAGQSAVVTTALVITVLISSISTSAVAIFDNELSRIFFGSDLFQSHVSIYGILLITGAIEVYGLTYFRLQEKPVVFIVNSICKLILQLALNILFVVYWDMGVMGVVYSGVISSSVFSIIALIYILYNTGFVFSKVLVTRFFRFSWPLWVAGLAGLYIGSSSRFFIRVFADLEQVGLYELATKFAMILPMLIWKPFSQWWQTERFKLYHSTDKGTNAFPLVFNAIGIVLTVVATGICILSGPVIQIMSSEPFHRSISAVIPLVYAALVSDLTNFFLFSFLVTEKTIYITFIRILSAFVITALFFILIPKFGYVGAAYSVLIATISVFILSMALSKRLFDNKIKLTFILCIITFSAFIVIFDSIINHLLEEIEYQLIAKLILIFVYLFVTVILIKIDPKLWECFLIAKGKVKEFFLKKEYRS